MADSEVNSLCCDCGCRYPAEITSCSHVYVLQHTHPSLLFYPISLYQPNFQFQIPSESNRGRKAERNLKDVMGNVFFSSSSLKLGFKGNIITLVVTLYWGNEWESPLETFWGLHGYWKTNEIILISQVIADSNDTKSRANWGFSHKKKAHMSFTIYSLQNYSTRFGYFIFKILKILTNKFSPLKIVIVLPFSPPC